MAGPIQCPVKGQPMRASWGAAVSSALNSMLPMGSSGFLARQGVAGTGFAPLPANLRDRRPSSDRGCFAIKSVTQQEKEEGETLKFTVEFRNKYASVGGKTYDFESLGPIEDVEEDSIVALKVGATAEDDTELAKFESIYALQNEQNTQENLYVIPLYKFGPGGSVKCDFRNMQLAAMGEF